jgi:SAM-dependent MidA family methyltransferase
VFLIHFLIEIAKVLDKANKDDIKQLKDHWQEVVDHAKSNDMKICCIENAFLD